MVGVLESDLGVSGIAKVILEDEGVEGVGGRFIEFRGDSDRRTPAEEERFNEGRDSS